MSVLAGPPQVELPARKQTSIWRVLVGIQLTVVLLIALSVLVVVIIGLLSSLFTQRSL